MINYCLETNKNEFLIHTLRQEYHLSNIAYMKAIRATLITIGYNPDYVDGDFKDYMFNFYRKFNEPNEHRTIHLTESQCIDLINSINYFYKYINNTIGDKEKLKNLDYLLKIIENYLFDLRHI